MPLSVSVELDVPVRVGSRACIQQPPSRMVAEEDICLSQEAATPKKVVPPRSAKRARVVATVALVGPLQPKLESGEEGKFVWIP